MVVSKTVDNSTWFGTNLAVPQGSVLGPLLFCLYIIDVRGALTGTENIRHLMYADDLQIYMQVPRSILAEGLATAGRAAAAVARWADRAALRLNASKTHTIIFGATRYINDIAKDESLCVQLEGGVTIPLSDSVTSLGVVLDSKLSWKLHIDAATKKFNRVLYSLRFFRKYTTEALRIKLATALLFPHLDYCSVVLLDASQEINNRLQVLQNSCVRYIYGVRGDEHITPYRKKLDWPRIETRRSYFVAMQMYKILRIRTPSYLYDRFHLHVPRGPTRGEKKELSVPGAQTCYVRDSLSCKNDNLFFEVITSYGRL